MRPRTVPLAVFGAGLAGLAYSAGYEVRAFRLRRFVIPVLPAGSPPLRILQVSDLHMTPGQRRKRAWVRDLARLAPDLVINTGDSLAHQRAVGPVLSALEPLLRFPGAFVPGSNDYYAPVPKNPARYLLPDSGPRKLGSLLPWPDLRDTMRDAGWADLTNSRQRITAAGRVLDLAGVDDPHIHADRYPSAAGSEHPDAELRIGVTHSPEPRVLDAMAADGRQLLIAGHTHGGQLRVPGYGALVTNCGLDRARARGVSRWGSGPDPAWLHVSAGLGTSPYTPVRFACFPEASLLTLVSRSAAETPD